MLLVRRQRRLALALLSGEFFGHPSRAMRVVGITGTNGKTTTSYLVSAMFEAAGVRCGLMGTVTYRIGSRAIDATRTTPEAPDMQQLKRCVLRGGVDGCRHMRCLRRVDGALSRWFEPDARSPHGTWRTTSQPRRLEMLPADAPHAGT
jgi:UDP-N-acetylmuramoyl-L-alanyl-D-glutamate--2,6-diaminopimelate ligase